MYMYIYKNKVMFTSSARYMSSSANIFFVASIMVPKGHLIFILEMFQWSAGSALKSARIRFNTPADATKRFNSPQYVKFVFNKLKNASLF